MFAKYKNNFKQYPEVKGNLLLLATSAISSLYLEYVQHDPQCIKEVSEFIRFHAQDFTALIFQPSLHFFVKELTNSNKRNELKDDALVASASFGVWTCDEFTNCLRKTGVPDLIANTDMIDIGAFAGGSATWVIARHIFRNHEEIGQNIKETCKDFVEKIKDIDVKKWLDKVSLKIRER